MASDNTSRHAKRKPTRRTERVTTAADSHYSKLTRKASGDTTAIFDLEDHKGASGAARHSKAEATQYETLFSGTERKVYGAHARKRRRSGNVISAFVALSVIGIFAYGAHRFWEQRSVPVTVNTTATSIRVGSTLDDLYAQAGVETTPGNYVSVNGNLIEEGTGYAYSVSIEDERLSRKDIDEYRIKGSEHIEFGTGDDRMEPYETTYNEEQPKLVFEGDGGAVSYVRQWGKPFRQEVRTGKDSQEMTEGETVSELEDCVVVTRDIHPADDQKLVALTFDDGPSEPFTQQCLDILAEHNVKATFFTITKNMAEHPELTKAVVEAGHQLCNHTKEHLDLSTLEQEALLSQIEEARRAIAETTGVKTTILRPPYNSFSHECWLKSQGAISVAITANKDTADYSMPGVEEIVNKAVTDIAPGNIILLHDGGEDRSQTVEALPQIIERLQGEGYTFVTLSELLASDPDISDDIASGHAAKPKDAVWPTEIRE